MCNLAMYRNPHLRSNKVGGIKSHLGLMIFLFGSNVHYIAYIGRVSGVSVYQL